MTLEEKEVNEIVIVCGGVVWYGYRLERALELLESGSVDKVMLVKKVWTKKNEGGSDG